MIGGKTLRRRAHHATGHALSAAEAITHAEQDAELVIMADEVAAYLVIIIIAIAPLLDPVRERMPCEVSAPSLFIASALGADAQLYGVLFTALQVCSPASV